MDYNKMLIDSAYSGCIDGVQSALKHGADVNSIDIGGNTALIWATANGHRETVEALLQASADIDLFR